MGSAVCVNLESFSNQFVIQFMGFSWQEYCSGLPFPPPVDIMDSVNMNLGKL